MIGASISILRFAAKMLRHDQAKTIAAVAGVGFAATLALVQIGLYAGAMEMCSAVIDQSSADLWVVPRGSQNFDFTQPLDEHLLYVVRSVPGVAKVEPLLVAFAVWQLPTGGMESVEIVGLDLDGDMLRPWNVMTGDPEDLRLDRNVFIDAGDLKKLHCAGVGADSEIYLVRSAGMRAQVVGLTTNIKSFVASPVVMTSYKNGLAFAQAEEGSFTYLLVRLEPGADPQQVKRDIGAASDRLEAYTRDEFSQRTRTYWDEATGLGIALFASAFMGAFVGVGTVAMTQYMSTLDHLKEYATLKALGVPNRRVIALIAAQAGVVGLVGFGLGAAMAVQVQRIMADRALIIVLTPDLLWSGLGATLAFCCLASVMSAVKIIRTDPGLVFHG